MSDHYPTPRITLPDEPAPPPSPAMPKSPLDLGADPRVFVVFAVLQVLCSLLLLFMSHLLTSRPIPIPRSGLSWARHLRHLPTLLLTTQLLTTPRILYLSRRAPRFRLVAVLLVLALLAAAGAFAIFHHRPIQFMPGPKSAA